jgi:DNA-binding protein Fis
MPSNNTLSIGTTFANNSQWHEDEINLINVIKNQIDNKFIGNNLLINTTWFGPQFDNDEYQKISKIKNIDNIFFLASVDPVMLVQDQLDEIANNVGAKHSYFLGNFDTEYQFNFISTLLPKYFKHYINNELVLKDPQWVFVAYNRKPREHRIELVKKIFDNNLKQYGVVTLGKNHRIYSGTDQEKFHFLLDENPDDYAGEGNWGHSMVFGVPHDIHSLGNLDIWQYHFLNVVSETEFNPWDNMFITEKTWKPILGLRPFVINGQTKIYKYLRDNGFKTFNHYFPVELENISERTVHDSIIDVIQYLSKLNKQEILDLYQQMLPDLEHNRQRFFDFAQEQQHKIGHLFK